MTPPLETLAVRLPSSTIGAVMLWVPLATVIEAPVEVPRLNGPPEPCANV